MTTSTRPDKLRNLAPLTDQQLLRSIYTTTLLTFLLPPFIGGSLMGLVGFYPMPEFYLIFTDYSLPYVLAVLGLALLQVPRWHRFIVGLTQLERKEAETIAHRTFIRLPWILLGAVTLYSMGGAFSADLSLEHMGIRGYTPKEHLYNQFGIIPVVLLTAFPIFFYFVDRLGRYLGPRGVSVTAIPLWVKLLMLGIVTPLLIDSLLLGYYFNRTGFFHWETLVLWLSLLALAIGGTWIAWRSLQQGISPLQAFIDAGESTLAERARSSLNPLSLDEFGVLTSRFNALLTKQQELAVDLSATRLLANAVVDSAGALVVVLDAEGRFVRFNRACEALTGYTYDEVAGRFLWDMVLPPEVAEEIGKRAFPALVRNPPEASVRYINSWVSRYGKRFLIEWSNSVLRDADGKVEFVVSVGTDITEREKTKRELVDHAAHLESLVAARTATLEQARQEATAAETMLRYVLDATPSRIFWKDTAGRYLGCNQSFAVDAGKKSPQDLVGLTDFDMAWKASADLYRADDALVVNSGTAKLNFEEPMDLPDGSRMWLSTSKVPLRDANGEVIGVLGAYDIITERKALEESLKEVAARLNAAQQVARVGDFLLDLRSGSLVWSDTTYELVGLAPGSVMPSNDLFLSLIHPDDRPAVREEMAAALAGRYVPDADGQARLPDLSYRVIHADGTVLWLHAMAIGDCDADGRVVRIRGTVQDITARKQVEAALVAAKDEAERANRTKSEFLSRMSHELRTPMNAILGFSQVLEAEGLPPEQEDYIQEIQRAGDHLLELINELLDLSRIETGKLAAVVQALDLKVVLNQALNIVQPMMTVRRIALLNECTAPPPVLADPTRLRQVLVNLLSNATKYNREGGRITLTCRHEGEAMLRVGVTDTGQGIPPEKLELLFQPFERLGAQFTEVEGSGIGLALSKQLAELMGAKLGVDTAPGRGTTFWIDLPLAEVDAAALAVEVGAGDTPTVPGGKAATVLYVEDNPANLRVVEAMFRHHPHLRLLSATNGEYGLELARRYKPDVMLLDIHLPGMDGYAVLKALQTDPDTQHIPAIALSADAMPLDVELGLKAGFRAYLTKPVKVDELIAALESVLPASTASAG